ncbi:MAG: hypothetical protein KF745_04950 [Phycisphaeraceae bacterium]|nr:hypothetical protein [Phycisphaeraceae bacterium]
MTALLRRFHALPRAARWLTVFVACMIAYFAIIEPILDRTNAFVTAADNAEASLARERSLAADWSNPARPLAVARTTFGTPALPGPVTSRTAALFARVNTILDAHNIRAEIAQKQVSLAAEQAAILAQPGERIDRLILDVTFEADPATVATVLAELERSDEVTAVSRVAIRRADSRSGRSESGSNTVRAELAAEAWVRSLPSTSTGGNR